MTDANAGQAGGTQAGGTQAGGTQAGGNQNGAPPSVLAQGGGNEAPPSVLAQGEATYNWQLPQGVEINKDVLGKFEGLARGLNLKADQAQPLVDLWVEATQGYENRAIQEWIDQGKQWETEIKADPQVGGAHFNESLSLARKGLDYAGKEFSQYIEDSGLGNNPQIFKFLAKVGKSLSEDRAGTFTQGQQGKEQGQATAEEQALAARYPKMAEHLRGGR